MYIYRSEYAYVVSVYVYILKSSRRLRLTSLSICLCKNGLETGADNLIGYVVKILGTVNSSEHMTPDFAHSGQDRPYIIYSRLLRD
jgi:hypothetical protein